MTKLPVGKANKPFNKVTNIKSVKKVVKKYNYIQDPGHGWLSVSHKDIIELGIKDLISGYSYMNSTRVFLEEDGDAGIFVKAAKAMGWTIETKSSHTNNQASCRSYANYNVAWIDNPFTIGRTVYFHGSDLTAIVEEKTKTGWNLKASNGITYRVPRLNPLGRILPSDNRGAKGKTA